MPNVNYCVKKNMCVGKGLWWSGVCGIMTSGGGSNGWKKVAGGKSIPWWMFSLTEATTCPKWHVFKGWRLNVGWKHVFNGQAGRRWHEWQVWACGKREAGRQTTQAWHMLLCNVLLLLLGSNLPNSEQKRLKQCIIEHALIPQPSSGVSPNHLMAHSI